MRWRLALVSLGAVCLLAVPATTSADVNDFVITDFQSDQTLTNRDPQGELHIVERISVNFHDFNHGILRAIPKSYKHHSLQLQVNKISSETGAATKYTTYTSNGNTVLKIGDANRTITGPQQYTIDYTVRNVLTFYGDHTELYWDVNGDQWGQPTNHVQATLHLPKGLQQSRTPLCFTGSFGSAASNCTAITEGSSVKVATTQPLLANQGLTYVVGLENGTFRPSKWYDTVGEYLPIIVGVSAPAVLIGGAGLAWWWRRGRDARGTGVVVPQYDAPDAMTPLQVDGLIDFSVGNAAITATIIDLAIRGYLQIVEQKQVKKLRKDTLSYSLKLTSKDLSGLNQDELKIISALFTQQTAGETVDLSKKKNKLYSTATYLRTHVKQQLKDDGYLRGKLLEGDKPHMARNVLLGLIALLALFIYSGPFVFIGLGIGVLVLIMCLMFMDARTAKGVAAKEHIEGLKLYLNVAEKDRIKKLQAPDAAYAEQSAKPEKTVELFEKLLPYAIVLGVEQQWAKQFEKLYTTPPDWYDGNWHTFNAVYLTSHLNQGIGTAVNTAFSSPSSSGSSGFSGGSSGGGGGGGGGGGW